MRAIELAAALAVLVWLGCGSWVFNDARRRLDDPLLLATATALGLTPLVGPLLYLILRPRERLVELRMRALGLLTLARLTGDRCPTCRAEIADDFLVCPVCTAPLRHACGACGAPLERAWQLCPYCESPVPSEATRVP